MGLKEQLGDLEKRFGKGIVLNMAEENDSNVECISTGSLKLDAALGGGFAVGKIHEIYSESGCGKTSICLETAVQCQKNGGKILYVDMECALNMPYAEQLGIDKSKFYLTQPSCGEHAFEVIKGFIKSGEVDLIIVDSVSALTPLAEINGEAGEAKMAVTARLMGQGLRMITNIADKNKCTIIFINQLRQALGGYIVTNVTSGGKALQFFSTQRLELRSSKIRKGDQVVGFTQKINVTKNKIAPPFQKCEREILYDEGFNTVAEILDLAIDHDICQRKGAWFYYGTDIKLGQGKAAALDTLRDNPELVEEIEKKVKAIIYK